MNILLYLANNKIHTSIAVAMRFLVNKFLDAQ